MTEESVGRKPTFVEALFVVLIAALIIGFSVLKLEAEVHIPLVICAAIAALVGRGPGFDELLTDVDGNCLWVTSHPVTDLPDGVRNLGVVPWSPRTPVVRPAPG